MSWSEVELDFGGDETCNFGPRIESGSPLYQVNTLATISHSGQVKKLPKVCSSLSSKGLCIAADQQVSAFDENCQKLLVILSFETFVDVIKWSDDSTFLIIAERSGTVHFAHSGMGKILYSQTLLENVDLDQECFVGAELCRDPLTDVWNFLVLTKETLFRFPKISFNEINKAIKTGNIQAVQEMMVYSAVDVSSQHEITHSLTCYTQMDGAYAITAGTGDKRLAVWRLEAENTELYQCIPSLKEQGEGFKKCIVYDDYIFAVDEKNVLSAFDKRSLIQVAHWSEMEIKDLILINYNPVISSNNTKVDDVLMQAVAITASEGECFLKVFSLPGMLCVYSLAISHHSYIAKMPPSYETIYLVEGTGKDEDDTSGIVSTLRVRCLTEALPETRFHRLLHKGKFSEAEQFANLFGLDLQLVHKTRANHLMKNMTMEYDDDSEANGMTGQIKELTDCLDQVTDERFIGTICSDVGLPTLTANQMLLDYAHNRVS
ncbi:Kinetochore-associated protein 1 [Holothuria leucospilota]|uniref:Kinetochore-associated protein 1 n=1 Tax=Holothuria leucospilota TaxID=206669 RepID=A0A9Q1CPP1_HOLLE|nr:Kinetochore-associated protein 1 [Holothuria leucospilota]